MASHPAPKPVLKYRKSFGEWTPALIEIYQRMSHEGLIAEIRNIREDYAALDNFYLECYDEKETLKAKAKKSDDLKKYNRQLKKDVRALEAHIEILRHSGPPREVYDSESREIMIARRTPK